MPPLTEELGSMLRLDSRRSRLPADIIATFVQFYFSRWPYGLFHLTAKRRAYFFDDRFLIIPPVETPPPSLHGRDAADGER